MILREKTGIYELLFATQGSVLPRILPRIIGVSLLAVLIVWVDGNIVTLPHTNVAPFAVFGIALSLFLGFRATMPPMTAGGRAADCGGNWSPTYAL